MGGLPDSFNTDDDEVINIKLDSLDAEMDDEDEGLFGGDDEMTDDEIGEYMTKIGKLGFIEGISNIILKNLSALDISERPVHCSDLQRDIVYIKDEDKWEKEDDDKKKLRNVINKVSHKNERLLQKYKEVHPGCNFSESKYSDQYSKLVIEAMGGAGNNDKEKAEKIIRNIAKEVVIDKSVL